MKSEFKPAVYAFLLLVSVVSIGIIGFMIIEGFSFIESFFMTIITVATVGFQEVHPLSDAGSHMLLQLLHAILLMEFSGIIIKITK